MIKRKMLLFLAILCVTAAVILGCYYGLKNDKLVTVGEPFDQERLDEIAQTLDTVDPPGSYRLGRFTYEIDGLFSLMFTVKGYSIRGTAVVQGQPGILTAEVFCLSNIDSARWTRYVSAWQPNDKETLAVSLGVRIPRLESIPIHDLKPYRTSADRVNEYQIYFFVRLTVPQGVTAQVFAQG